MVRCDLSLRLGIVTYYLCVIIVMRPIKPYCLCIGSKSMDFVCVEVECPSLLRSRFHNPGLSFSLGLIYRFLHFLGSSSLSSASGSLLRWEIKCLICRTNIRLEAAQ